jgi:hypothetical protein
MLSLRLVGLIAVVCSLLSACGQAEGQERPPTSPVSDPQNNIDLARFAKMPSVRNDLKLTEAQVSELTAIETEMRRRIQEILRQLSTLEGEEKTAAAQGLQKELDFARPLLAAVFTPDQIPRVKQLALQYICRNPGSGFGLLSKAMMKELEISQEQANVIRAKAAAIDAQLKAREAEMKTELETLRVKLQTELIDSLEPAQSAKVKSLLGTLIPLEE